MSSLIRYGIVFIGLAGAAWVGCNTYAYFFSETAPTLSVAGIEPDSCYAGDVECTVTGKDAYKVATISLSLDDKPLAENFKINKKAFKHTFSIPTKTLSHGNHKLHIEAHNGTFNKAKSTKDISFCVDNLPLQAAFVKGDTDAKVFQGRTLHIQFQVNKEIKEAQVKALSKTYPCFAESAGSLIYECYIPTECDEIANEYPLTIEISDRVGNTIHLESKFQVVLFPFKKQNLKFDADKIKAENEAGLSEKHLEAEIEALTHKSPQKKLWQGVFVTPTEIKEPRQITTDFGVIRTTQERGLRQHKALDLYNTPRSVVWAPQDGIVALKNRYAHSGNTIVIDHGYGVLSLIFHLDSFANIEVGEKIKRGNPVGYLGKTGYATGYHVHWEMRVNNIAIDPMQWTKHDF
ncbi:M23 family metallopeptidase [Candidatus Dependentiae bacterium]|nr:M23 family metallopeptidase [Candidatus Dependentiae bacterium]